MKVESKSCNGLVREPGGTNWPPSWLVVERDKRPTPDREGLVAEVLAAWRWPADPIAARQLGELADRIDAAYLAGDLSGMRAAVADALSLIRSLPLTPDDLSSATPPPEVLSAWRREQAAFALRY